MAVTTASGDTYPESGLSQRRRVTRSLADESSWYIARNEPFLSVNICRREEDPPKNESGATATPLFFTEMRRCVNSGDGP